MNFEELQLIPPILKALAQCGHTNPTAVQAQAIPKALAGRNLIASAQTGTGKTAAFVLPALQRLSAHSPTRKAGPRVLIVTPTRELADQVTQATRTYGKYLSVSSLAIFGGMPFGEQVRSLAKSPDMIIATPGRLLDHMNRGRIDLSHIELFILDEADRMLDMGFIEDVERITAAVPVDCQILLFAATVGETMTKLAQKFIKNPERVQVSPDKVTHDLIEQRLFLVDDLQHKTRLLQHFCNDQAVTKAIIFSATKCDADSLARDLNGQGYLAAALHGDMNQVARNRTMMNMRRGKIRLLVATDVAARGLDVLGISHIINFDLPRFAEDYIHRIGRTGRAGESGIAISFASRGDIHYINRIERYLKQNLTRHIIPGLEPAYQLNRPDSLAKHNRRGQFPKSGSLANSSPHRRTPRNLNSDERIHQIKDSRIQVKGSGRKTFGRSTGLPLERKAFYGRGKQVSTNRSSLAGKPQGPLLSGNNSYNLEIFESNSGPKDSLIKSRPGSTKETGHIKRSFADVRQASSKQDGGVEVEYRKGNSRHPGRPGNLKGRGKNYFRAKD
ncbi:MAG: ATP-dependent helicase [Desulfobacca sp.]|nr:ATP-dependent helicase [Desulfobacca sp.]